MTFPQLIYKEKYQKWQLFYNNNSDNCFQLYIYISLRTVSYVLTRCSPIDVSNRLPLTFYVVVVFVVGNAYDGKSTESYIVGLDKMAMVCLFALHKTNA